MPSDLSAMLARCSETEIRDHLSRCCGSQRWIAGVLSARPWQSETDLREKADRIWEHLDEADYLQAFSHHPAIGSDPEALRQKFAGTANWSSGEQSGMQAASEATIQGLAQGNQEYLKKFGFVFLICATGQSAEAMLQALQARLPNDRPTEIQNAAREQAKITQIRLTKLKAELQNRQTD